MSPHGLKNNPFGAMPAHNLLCCGWIAEVLKNNPVVPVAPPRSCGPGEASITHDPELIRKFIAEAEHGGMRYLVENGRVIAWGAAVEGIFSMVVDVEDQKDSTGEYVVTLPVLPGKVPE